MENHSGRFSIVNLFPNIGAQPGDGPGGGGKPGFIKRIGGTGKGRDIKQMPLNKNGYDLLGLLTFGFQQS